MLESIATNPWVTLCGFILTALSFILAIFFYFRGKKEKIPSIAKRTTTLIEGLEAQVKDVTVTFKGRSVPNLSITKIAFWNAGRDAITNSDIPSKDTLRIKAKDGVHILDHSIIFTKNPKNNFVLTEQPGGVITVEMEFVRKDEGIIIQILHTGTSNSDIKFLGSLKDVPKIKYAGLNSAVRLASVIFKSKRIKPEQARRILGFTFILTPVFLGGIFFGLSRVEAAQKPADGLVILISWLVVCVMYVGMGLSVLRRSTPDGFDAFFEDKDNKKEPNQ
jgi:hypothetical protein